MLHLVITTHNLGIGGVQKNVTILAEYFAQLYKVTVLVFEKTPCARKLSARISVVALPEKKICPQSLLHEPENAKRVGVELFSWRAAMIEKALEALSPDMVIAFEDYNALCLLSTWKPGTYKTIISPRVSLDFYCNRLVHLMDAPCYDLLRRRYYPEVGAIVCNTRGVSSEIQRRYNISSEVIENGIDLAAIELIEAATDFKTPFILHVGRFDSAQKGQIDLLHAFAAIAAEIPHELRLMGDGKDRALIERTVDVLQLNGRVVLHGFCDNAASWMKACDLFVFPSCYEGFPNVLLEAFACGAPVVSYDFAPSADEVTQNGQLCRVVPRGNVALLAAGMKEMLADKKQRNHLVRLAKNSVLKYSEPQMVNKWERLCAAFLA
ncbi:MAG: glycosyltransferase [Candidatus Ozemobacteraceae bacterium]